MQACFSELLRPIDTSLNGSIVHYFFSFSACFGSV
jgi:hypothetical protein